jgi:hypothetical protein
MFRFLVYNYIIFILLLFVSFFAFLANPSYVNAQVEITEVYDLQEGSFQGGDIVVMSDAGLSLANREYDPKIFGVVQSDPLAVYRRIDKTGTPLTRTGNAEVNVSTVNNGPIKKGDYITTSNILGKGQKAIASGYVLGVSMQDFDGNEGKILVALRIEYAEITSSRNTSRLFESLNAAILQNSKDPDKLVNIVRYIGVSVVDILTILIGLFILARVIPKGVEGIGRNPYARKSIIIYTIVNVGIVAAVVFLGVGVSLLLLRV